MGSDTRFGQRSATGNPYKTKPLHCHPLNSKFANIEVLKGELVLTSDFACNLSFQC